MTRLMLLEATQKLIDDERTGLNKDHTIGEFLDYLDDPTTVVELEDERARIVKFIKARQDGWRHDNREIGQALEDVAWAIENGEHLK